MIPHRSTTPHATEMVKLTRYHEHSLALLDRAKMTPKARLTKCWRTPANPCFEVSKNQTVHCEQRSGGREVSDV